MRADVHSANAYDLLGVPRDADGVELREAFRKVALKHHPDALPLEERAEAATLFMRIHQAHEVLRNAQKRQAYNALLATGVVPDMAEQSGETSWVSLAALLQELHTPEITVESTQFLLENMSVDLAAHLLGTLISLPESPEKILEVAPVRQLLRWEGFTPPAGQLKEAWLVITEFRTLLLLRYLEAPDKGRLTWRRHRTIHLRSLAFPHLTLQEMRIEEMGKAFPFYQTELEDEDGRSVHIQLKSLRLTRLVLVLSNYDLPLTLHTQGKRLREYRRVWAWSLAPLFLWLVGFLVVPCVILCVGAGSGASWCQWLNENGLTAAGLYLPPLVFLLLAWRVYLSWDVRSADEVLGLERRGLSPPSGSPG